MKHLCPLCLLLLALTRAISGAAQTNDTPIEAESLRGQFSYDLRTGLAIYTNGVVFRYSNVVLTADSASLNQDTGEARALGNVVLNRAGELWRAAALRYNFKTGEMGADEFRLGLSPFFTEIGRAHV